MNRKNLVHANVLVVVVVAVGARRHHGIHQTHYFCWWRVVVEKFYLMEKLGKFMKWEKFQHHLLSDVVIYDFFPAYATSLS